MNEYVIDEWVKTCRLDERYVFFEKHPLDDRVSRLFAVACCREIWDKLTNEQSKAAIEIAEIYADKLTSKKELNKSYSSVWLVLNNFRSTRTTTVYSTANYYMDYSAITYASTVAYYSSVHIPFKQQGIILAQMYPTTFNEQYINPTTTALAHNIYNNKDFSLMPILADALQDVDCTEDILLHLRSKGPFYKGNYIIDMLTGKR